MAGLAKIGSIPVTSPGVRRTKEEEPKWTFNQASSLRAPVGFWGVGGSLSRVYARALTWRTRLICDTSVCEVASDTVCSHSRESH